MVRKYELNIVEIYYVFSILMGRFTETDKLGFLSIETETV